MTLSRPLWVGYLVPPSPTFAGVERVVHDIATKLSELEHNSEVTVTVLFCNKYQELEDVTLLYSSATLGVRRILTIAAPLRSFLRDNPLDILIVPQVEASVAVLLSLAMSPSPRVITHLHGNPKKEWEYGSFRTRVAFAAFRLVLHRWLLGTFNVSNELADLTAEKLAPNVEAKFVPNPVRAMRPVRGATRKVSLSILVIARLEYQKGIDVLLRAVSIARKEMTQFSVTVIGAGSLESSLRAERDSLGLSDEVFFAGAKTDVQAYLDRTDLLVLPSRWEGFPLVLLEALGVGVRVLASDCEFGPKELITDPRLGRLFESENEHELAQALVQESQRADSNADRELRIGAAQQFTIEHVAGLHLRAIKELARSLSNRND